jgi:DUF2075 family protein
VDYRNSGFAGSWPQLVAEPEEALLRRLVTFIPDASEGQRHAWRQELSVLRSEGARVLEFDMHARTDSAVLEYMLPREAGRRPDVLVLQNGRVVVVEFKEGSEPRHSALDQVKAYARDLLAYHEACTDLAVVPVLVLCGEGAGEREIEGVRVVPASRLSKLLIELGRSRAGRPIDLDAFLDAEYAPLPSLVAAARLLFQNLPLPFVKRAQSAGVHRAVDHVLELAHSARASATGRKQLVLLTGVPGAGKTLVGLQVAHAAALEEGFELANKDRKRGAPATFLSGNGPLVQVLRHALKSTVFVQDMHRYIREYGLEHPDRIPRERLIVFDEAQRAWDREKIADFYSKKAPHVPAGCYQSEPQLLVDIASRIEGWTIVLGLVGEGQEIHTGEETGISQWADALRTVADEWEVHAPAALEEMFMKSGVTFRPEPVLSLDSTLRAHAASDLHQWVRLVLDECSLDQARTLADRLRNEGFPIYLTRDVEDARSYAFSRFAGERDRRYGFLASSKARNLGELGLDPGFQATKKIQVGPWFNDGPESPRSCCRLDTVITEFQCQGLELDLPIVCWGDDFWWERSQWELRPTRVQRLVRDPHRLRTNAYRVLLTRGREGIVILVPPSPEREMNATADALARAGALHVRGIRDVAVAS